MSADLHDPMTWEEPDELDFAICPACVVPVSMQFARQHIDAKHKVTVREAIVHSQPEGLVKDFILKASYAEQIAALHARQYWEQDEVERVLGAIYAYQGTGALAALQSTWDALNRAAVAWVRA